MRPGSAVHYSMCDLGQITQPLCGSVSSTVKWVMIKVSEDRVVMEIKLLHGNHLVYLEPAPWLYYISLV